MKIRQASISDIKTLTRIIRNSYHTVADKFGFNNDNCPKHPSNCTDKWVKSDMERGITYFLLESCGKGIGCVALEKANQDLWYLERLAVIPESRNKGFGKSLVEYVFHEAQLHRCKRISIGIIAKQNELKNWYSKFGFKEGLTKSFDHLPFEVTFMECDII